VYPRRQVPSPDTCRHPGSTVRSPGVAGIRARRMISWPPNSPSTTCG